MNEVNCLVVGLILINKKRNRYMFLNEFTLSFNEGFCVYVPAHQ